MRSFRMASPGLGRASMTPVAVAVGMTRAAPDPAALSTAWNSDIGAFTASRRVDKHFKVEKVGMAATPSCALSGRHSLYDQQNRFQRVFPDDAACARYLRSVRWPDGFTCPKCGATGEPYRFPTRSSVVLRCRKCKANTSLTAGTVMQSSHTPLSTWFWGAYPHDYGKPRTVRRPISTPAQGNRVKLFYRVIRLARKSSSHPAVFRLSRREAFPGANRIRFCAMCLIVQKLAGA